MLKASIDIGSNSILLLAADLSAELKILLNKSNVTGLGRDLDKNGKFLDIAMEESFQVLREYTKACADIGITPSFITVTATEASRVASNSEIFYTKVKEELGLSVHILSGEGEAYYATQGILFDKNIEDKVITIMDIGGASTEIIRVDRESRLIENSFSMPVGAVRLNNWKASGSLDEKLNRVLADFSDQLNLMKTETLYCVAGTMTSVGNMYLGHKNFIEDDVNGLEMSSSEVHSMLSEFEDFSSQQFLERFPFLGKRAKTIYSGLILSTTLLKRLNITKLKISTYGLRYGVILAEEIEDKYVWKQY